MCAACVWRVREKQCCVFGVLSLVPKPVIFGDVLQTCRAVSFITWAIVTGQDVGLQLRFKTVQRCSFN